MNYRRPDKRTFQIEIRLNFFAKVLNIFLRVLRQSVFLNFNFRVAGFDEKMFVDDDGAEHIVLVNEFVESRLQNFRIYFFLELQQSRLIKIIFLRIIQIFVEIENRAVLNRSGERFLRNFNFAVVFAGRGNFFHAEGLPYELPLSSRRRSQKSYPSLRF